MSARLRQSWAVEVIASRVDQGDWPSKMIVKRFNELHTDSEDEVTNLSSYCCLLKLFVAIILDIQNRVVYAFLQFGLVSDRVFRILG